MGCKARHLLKTTGFSMLGLKGENAGGAVLRPPDRRRCRCVNPAWVVGGKFSGWFRASRQESPGPSPSFYSLKRSNYCRGFSETCKRLYGLQSRNGMRETRDLGGPESGGGGAASDCLTRRIPRDGDPAEGSGDLCIKDSGVSFRARHELMTLQIPLHVVVALIGSRLPHGTKR